MDTSNYSLFNSDSNLPYSHMLSFKSLPDGKKIFFISDFHLGVPDALSSLEREKKIVRWLDEVKYEAQAIFILGDLFDFWFEYKHTIPKGFVRIQGKLAALSDTGLPIYFFTGNHDMWMADYFSKELGVTVFHNPIELQINDSHLLIGHGDGLGPGDYSYKFLKKIFSSNICQSAFRILPSTLSFGLAQYWSRHSRISNNQDEVFLGEKEFLLLYCKEIEKQKHHDFYVFGHRHLPLNLEVSPTSRYINLGEWVHHFTYASFDGQRMELLKFES